METEKWVESAIGNLKVFHSHSFKMVLLRKEKKEKLQISSAFYILVLILSSLDAISKVGFIAIVGGRMITIPNINGFAHEFNIC